MRVMGVDPGLTRCGLAVVEGGLGKPLRMIAVGVVRTPTSDDPSVRLLALQIEIDDWISRYEPEAIAVEQVFAKANIKGIMGTAQASAVPMLAAAHLGLPLSMHTPTEVKAAVTGNGRADKAQVTAMVTRILRLETRPKPADAADALALAICRVWRGGAQDRLRLAAQNQLAAQQTSAQNALRARELRQAGPSQPELTGPPRTQLAAPKAAGENALRACEPRQAEPTQREVIRLPRKQLPRAGSR